MPYKIFCNSMVFLQGTGNSVGKTGSCQKKGSDCMQTRGNANGYRQAIGLRGGRTEKAEWHEVKQVENELCQDIAKKKKKITSVLSPWLSYVLLSDFYCCCTSPSLPVILVMFGALVSSCAKWEQSRGLNSASVFRCTNGITEAKMAGGERWARREQQTAPPHCCCCRYAKPLDCDGMGSVWERVF